MNISLHPLIEARMLSFLIVGIAVVYGFDIFGTQAAQECFDIYRDVLPIETEIVDLTKGKGIITVQYQHNAGTGSIHCAFHADGSLDFETSMNNKIDLLWDNPDMTPRKAGGDAISK